MGPRLRPARDPRPGRLGAAPRVAADEEDVALSAFESFCRGAAEGRFPRLDDRDDLWQLLFVITARKAAGLARRRKRGGGHAVHALAATGARLTLSLLVLLALAPAAAAHQKVATVEG